MSNDKDNLTKGAMKRLAPKPPNADVKMVGGGSGSQYHPIDDPNHKKRAAFKLVKDRLNANPKSVKMVNGQPHILLHRGLDSQSPHNSAPHTTTTETHVEHGPDGGQYTVHHDAAKSFGDNVNSIWAPVSNINNYSEYAWRQAAQSAHRYSAQDINDPEATFEYEPNKKDLVEFPLSEENGKHYFNDVPHVLVGNGKYVKASPEEVNAANDIDSKRNKGSGQYPDMKRPVDLNIKPRLNKVEEPFIEPLEKKCPRCGKPSANKSNSSGRCSSCLKKLKTAKKTPGHWQRAQTKADDALRRQKGKNGTAHKKSSGLGSRDSIVKQTQSAEKKTGEKLSPDRKNNGKGYAAKNTRMVPEKLNRGRHHVDPKKLRAWKSKMKKSEIDTASLYTLLKAKAQDNEVLLELIKSLGPDGIAQYIDLFDIE